MTIRLRLSLLFTALVSVLLAGFAVVVFGLLAIERAKDFDALLSSRALLAAVVALEQNEVDSAQHALTIRRFERSALSEEQFVVLSSRGNLVFESDSLRSSSVNYTFQPDAALILQSRTGATLWKHDYSAPYSRFLPIHLGIGSVYLPYDDENERYVVVLQAFDKDGEQTLADAAWILALAVLSSVVLVFGVGWIFAGRVLRPVDAMTRLAEDISASNLAQRLPEGNGRDELAHLARAFNATFSRLERAFAAQKHFVAHASHEIRTPLTAMIGEIGVTLSQPRCDEEYRETLDSVLGVALQMRQMASDLLQLARVESGTLAHEFAPFAMDEVVLEAIELMQVKYPQRLILPTIHPVPTSNDELSFLVLGAVEILRLIVVNILDNALKYSPEESIVSLKLSREADYCMIEICDFGAGISEDEQERVFEPFFRSDRTRETPGTGVGLAFVAEAVRLHQGLVRLKSAEEQGTTVTVILPLHAAINRILQNGRN